MTRVSEANEWHIFCDLENERKYFITTGIYSFIQKVQPFYDHELNKYSSVVREYALGNSFRFLLFFSAGE